MENHSTYILGIQQRTTSRFIIGLLARIPNYIKNRIAIFIAENKGAKIGKGVAIPYRLAKKANSNLVIGDNVSIQAEELDLRAPITIGNNVIIGAGVKIITCSHVVDSPEWEFKSYGIKIEDYVWLSTESIILPSCTNIARGTVVGASAVLPYNTSEMDIVTGNPAQFLRKRKEVHHNLVIQTLRGIDLPLYIQSRRRKCL